LASHLHAVSSHVGDKTDGITLNINAFIQLLRQPHGLLRAKPEFPARFLLGCGGGERWWRIAFDPLALDRGDGEIAGLHRLLRALRERLGVEIELVELFAVQMSQPRNERGATRGEEMRLDRP